MTHFAFPKKYATRGCFPSGVNNVLSGCAAVFALLAAATFPLRASGWPDRVFAPYLYLGADDGSLLARCDHDCGQKYYTLAFIIADQHRNPAWDGRIPVTNNLYAGQISGLRARGGEVIVSFGGETGRELALVETNAAVLQAKYESVLDRYHFSWLDFDIEGRALENTRANERRNTALAGLQASHPGLILSYTLPVDPDGLSEDARNLLADARARGVRVHSANVMTMDFGPEFSRGKKMSDVSIASALRAREQCAAIDPQIQIGLTPDIGQNDVKSEIFTLADARSLKDWAVARPWVCSLSFWCSNRDCGPSGSPDGDHSSGIPQKPWDFTRIFQGFTHAK
jgi:chitinase